MLSVNAKQRNAEERLVLSQRMSSALNLYIDLTPFAQCESNTTTWD